MIGSRHGDGSEREVAVMRSSGTRLALPASALAALLLFAGACSDSTSSGGQTGAFAGLNGPSLYAQACASCHGADLAGTDAGPPFLDAVYRAGHHADVAFLLAVRRGARSHHWDFGNMPPVEGLTDEQVAAIVQFVRERQVAAGIE